MHPRCQLLSGRISTQGAVLRSAQSTQRTYATSAPTPAVKNPIQRRRGGDLGSHLPKHVIPKDAYIPAYPYGDHKLFKQANKGLYGEQRIRFGNNVSEDTETRTRRNWKPNVLSKSLYSVALKKRIKLRITAKVLKTMDREGGLDEYLLKDNPARIKELGPMGWALRWTLMQKPEVIARLRAEAAALGIDQATIDKQWPTTQMMATLRAAQGDLAQGLSTNGLETEEFTETEEQEMWDPEETEDSTSVTKPTTPAKPERSKPENRVAVLAALEYARALKASQRYLTRGLVDDQEAGLKLAFIRAKERAEAATRLKRSFKTKLEAQNLTPEDLENVKRQFQTPTTTAITDAAAKRLAYTLHRRKQIEQAGSYEAWRASLDPEKSALRAQQLQDAGGPEAYLAQRKTMYANIILEAESASSTKKKTLSAAQRAFFQTALDKADRAIMAVNGGGEDVYVDFALDTYRRGRKQQGGSGAKGGGSGGKDLARGSRRAESGGKDAWAAIVDSSNKLATERRVSA